MKKTLFLAAAVLLSAFLAPGKAIAQDFCDNQAGGMQLPLPPYNQPFHKWVRCNRNALEIINSSAALVGSTTAVHFAKINVDELGAWLNSDITISSAVTITSTLTVRAASLFTGAMTIPDDTITEGKIEDGAVTTSKLHADSLRDETKQASFSQLGVGTDNPGFQAIGTFSGAHIVGGAVNGEVTALFIQNTDVTVDTAGAVCMEMGVRFTARPGGKICAGRDGTYAGASTADSNLQFYTALDSSFVQRMHIDSNGNVGIGEPAPVSPLDIKNPTANRTVLNINSSDDAVGYLIFENADTSFLTQLYDAAGVAKVRLHSTGDSYFLGGNVGVGTNSPNHLLTLGVESNDTLGPNFAFNKSKAGGAVVTATTLGDIRFYGHDGGNLDTQGAKITAITNGTIATNKMPTDLVFATAEGASSDDLAEKMRLTSDGKLGIGIPNPPDALSVLGHIQASGSILFDGGDYGVGATAGIIDWSQGDSHPSGFSLKTTGKTTGAVKIAADGNTTFLSSVTINAGALMTGVLKVNNQIHSNHAGSLANPSIVVDYSNTGFYVIESAIPELHIVNRGVEAITIQKTAGGFNQIGIGTDDPNAKLEILPTVGSLYTLQVSSQNGTAVMVVDRLGNVGIGGVPTKEFHLQGPSSNYQLAFNSNSAGSNYCHSVYSGNGLTHIMNICNNGGLSLTGSQTQQAGANSLLAMGGISINATNPETTLGLTIHQAGNDDAIISLKSSDVGHSMTDNAETDTYGTMQKAHSTLGGLQINAFSDGDTGPLVFKSFLGTASPSAGTSGITFRTQKTDGGTGSTSLGANERSVTFADWGGNADVVIMGDGDMGIGAPAPVSKLHVGGAITYSGAYYYTTENANFRILPDASGGGAYDFTAEYYDGGAWRDIIKYSNVPGGGFTPLLLNSEKGGDVGIGMITTPAAQLEILPSVDDAYTLQVSSQNGTSVFNIDRLGNVTMTGVTNGIDSSAYMQTGLISTTNGGGNTPLETLVPTGTIGSGRLTVVFEDGSACQAVYRLNTGVPLVALLENACGTFTTGGGGLWSVSSDGDGTFSLGNNTGGTATILWKFEGLKN